MTAQSTTTTPTLDDDIKTAENFAMDAAKLIASGVVILIMLVALFRYGLGYALEKGGPFAAMALFAVGLCILVYLAILDLRIVRRLLSKRKVITQPEG